MAVPSPTFVGSARTSDSSVSSRTVTVTAGAPLADGDVLIAVFTTQHWNGETVSSVEFDLTAMTEVVTANQGGTVDEDDLTAAIYRYENTSGGNENGDVVLTMTGPPAAMYLGVYKINGQVNTDPADYIGNTGTTTAAASDDASVSVTTTQDDSLLIHVGGVNDPGGVPLDSNDYTGTPDVADSTNGNATFDHTTAFGTKDIATAAASTIGVNFAATDVLAAAAVEIKSQVAGAVAVPLGSLAMLGVGR